MKRATGRDLPRRNFIQPRQRIRVAAHQENQSGGLRVRFGAALFPLLRRSFVNPQFARPLTVRAIRGGEEAPSAGLGLRAIVPVLARVHSNKPYAR